MKLPNFFIMVIFVLVIAGFIYSVMGTSDAPPEPVACTADAMLCPDGTAVGRVGPNCEFAPCPEPIVVDEVGAYIESKKDLIVLESPARDSTITSPVTVSGKARGYWYFEATFPITIVDWDGRIIGQGYATAQDEWMTEEFVPFTATVSYDLPADTPYRRGAIILQKDNPSGLPENDDALEIPIFFE
jgi:hypothetical protein